ncbi:MAG: DUF364 domain-containing protein [Deltaproteobacteria bacterium]|nr:DUF364 domain-containing protein [Deltaproteobacteria bacterium]
MLLETLQASALAKAGDICVSDVRIGLGYTAVRLDTGSVGLAYTFRNKAESGCSVFQGKRPLAGSPVRDVLQYLSSGELLERTLGLAAANALFNTPAATESLPGCSSAGGDLLDVLALTKEDRVGMVGFFGPLVPVIRQRAGELIIFEENMARSDGLCPGSREAELLPACSVAIITATSIINNSFEHIAAAAVNCRITAVLGPSTPLEPDIFRGYGITHLSGVIGVDTAAILREVSEAGGTRFFMKWSKKINLILST